MFRASSDFLSFRILLGACDDMPSLSFYCNGIWHDYDTTEVVLLCSEGYKDNEKAGQDG